MCSKSTKITALLFGDDIAKQIKDISEVNKISRKVSCSSRDSCSSGSRTDGKTVTFSTRGKKGPFLGTYNFTIVPLNFASLKLSLLGEIMTTTHA